MRSYRAGFWVAVAAIVVLASAWAYSRQRRQTAPAASASDVVASGPPLTSAGSAHSGGAAGGAAGVAAGSPQLAPVQLSLAQRQAIGVRVGRVRYGPVAQTIRTVGAVAPDQAQLAVVQARFAGWVTHEYANQDYQYVRRGQPLITLYSPEVAASEAGFLAARQNRELLAASTVPGVAAGARSLLAASRERLAQWQVPEAEIARLARTGRPARNITLDAPATGYIFQRSVLPNQYVKPGTTLYKVADLAQVWVNAQVFQADAGMLRVGETAAVTVDAYPGLLLHARVDEIHPMVESATRTVPVRLVLANPGRKLTPGMFVNVRIAAPLGPQMTVPANAVLQTGTRNIAFVDRGGGYFTPRAVDLGPRVGDRFVVRRGLRAGERIATSANFLIDSESQLQAALGAYAPPPPGVGANATQPAAPQGRIQVTTAPSPPGKGANQVRVRLTGPEGKRILGAQVTVQFLMPAMPAMGMAAQHAQATLAGRGGGLYAGTVQLSSAGVWQVTVTATRHGQVIASRRIELGGGGQ